MCTVTFMPLAAGYALAMNRDEKRSRAAGLPPELFHAEGRSAIGPGEAGGGTWINLNDHGTTLALINWYSVKQNDRTGLISRGAIIQSLRKADTESEVQRGLAGLSLDAINPFRLIGVFPAEGKVIEWRWDLKRLVREEHPWKLSIWISSGFDEAGAQKLRAEAFQQATLQASAGSQDWLRRLHRSHGPECGPYSICMHREDAVTVSYTEVMVTGEQGRMRYYGGAPCEAYPEKECTMAILPKEG